MDVILVKKLDMFMYMCFSFSLPHQLGSEDLL